jgi:branched-chain amino acid transport system permease protein
MSIESLVFQWMNAVVWSWVLALLSLGLTLTFGYLDIVNVAHGVLYAIGAVILWLLVQSAGSAGAGFLMALMIAPLVVAIIGFLAFELTIRPIASRPPIFTLVTTFGLMFVLQHGLFLAFGGAPQSVDMPISTLIPMLGRTYPLYRFVMAGIAASLIVALWWFLHRSNYGTWIRAVQQNRDVATAMGIPARQVTAVVFCLGSALAGVAGVLAAPVLQVRYDMGVDIIMDAFMVVIAAGFGNLPGTVLIAMVYLVIQALLVMFVTPIQAKVIALSVLLTLVLVRRKGLLAKEKLR